MVLRAVARDALGVDRFTVTTTRGERINVRANGYYFDQGYLNFTLVDSDRMNAMINAMKSPPAVFSLRRSLVESIEREGSAEVLPKPRASRKKSKPSPRAKTRRRA